MQDLVRLFLFRSKVFLCLNLPVKIDAYKVILFDFELAFDWIDEERQLAAPVGILLRGAPHLPERQLHSHLRQNLTRLLQTDIMRLLGHGWFIAFPHPLRCGMAPCCIGF